VPRIRYGKEDPKLLHLFMLLATSQVDFTQGRQFVPSMVNINDFSSLMHVTDWLPTLYASAGGDLNDLPDDIDGVNQWPSLFTNSESPRNEMLYNSKVEGAAFRFS